MVTFAVSALLLIGSYFTYAKYLDNVFGADEKRTTPAIRLKDGVDYVPLPWYKIFLIQFLNIAGLGPIFGAVAGAMWGPVAFLWITLGCIFAGAMHDFIAGMMSLRMNGQSLPELIGRYLGNYAKIFTIIFTMILLVLVGAVFIMGPAKILTMITPNYLDYTFWVIIIFIYYILATLLPIDKLIAKIYPFFGLALLIMAVGISFTMFTNGVKIPELTFSNLVNMHSNSEKFPIFPMLYITIACGAISGFHATQSPMMARCLTNEKYGRKVFYGAMLSEGLVALIWSAVAMGFFGTVKELNSVMTEHNGNAAYIVNLISTTLMGKIGGALALLGVVACPITTGDTAFRSARLILADFFKFDQVSIKNRIIVAVPVFIIAFVLTQVKFDIIWRYFAWINQSLSVITLWTITVYLIKEQKNYWISLIPALFMSAVCLNYILVAPEGFGIKSFTSYIITLLILLIVIFYFYKNKYLINK
ncbi:MAG TPA: carbon starvation protein A [Melioribacteraceae bacterium]|nr:carbon starvation protein A [Melioribacteraceae bacterium]